MESGISAAIRRQIVCAESESTSQGNGINSKDALVRRPNAETTSRS